MSYKLIYSIVPQYNGELITNAAREAGSSGGTILMATETSANGIIQLLGFGDAAKDIALILVDNEKIGSVLRSIKNATALKKHNFGLLSSVPVFDFVKAGDADLKKTNVKSGEKIMNENSYKMINVIVNKGYAEDAMAAARKAGASGGTIIGARGTAKEGDAQFFGMNIVPEKDMLMILVPTEKKDDIIKAISELSCLSEAGSGIIFCNNANDFTLLGKSK